MILPLITWTNMSSYVHELVLSRHGLLRDVVISCSLLCCGRATLRWRCYTTVLGERETSPPQPRGPTVSVTWLLRSGQTEFSRRRSPRSFGAPCSDMRLGNWLDLNICMPLNVATESYDSVSSVCGRSEFSTHGCQSDPCFSKGREHSLPAAV